MKISFTRDEIAQLVETHVTSGLGIPFDATKQSITVSIASGYSSSFAEVTIEDKSDE